MNRNHIKQTFKQFLNQYDLTDTKVLLKIEHTYKAASICEEIAQKMNLSQEEIDLAWALGMFHDLGRFEQLKRYHTFQDAKSCNHAFLSCEILFDLNWIEQFQIDEKQYSIIDFCVRWHSAYKLPECDEYTYRLASILRDADKIDIIRVNVQSTFEEVYDMPSNLFYTSTITKEVWDDLMRCETVYKEHRKTAIDFRLSHIAFIFGLVYKESQQIMLKQGYLDQMLDFTNQIEEVNTQLKILKQRIYSYIER